MGIQGQGLRSWFFGWQILSLNKLFFLYNFWHRSSAQVCREFRYGIPRGQSGRKALIMPKIVVQYEIWRLIFHLAWPWLWRGRKVAQKVKNICVQVFGGLYWLNSKVVFNCCPVWTWHCKWRWIDLQNLILPRALMQSLCCEIFWWW